ncbi:MAG: helix-hairpin-helix domain-containing protein [Monoglobales bacterium]
MKKLIVPAVCAIIAGIITGLVFNVCSAKAHKTDAVVLIPDIKVYITGEISNPGLYEIGADVRLCELIEKAGGATENADLERLNPAAILTDGTTVEIPKIGSEEDIDPMIAATSQKIYEKGETKTKLSKDNGKIASGTININSAGVSDLMRLPGIGEATAEKVIAYRDANGEFKSVEEIMNVSGIGEKKFEAMKPFLAVE